MARITQQREQTTTARPDSPRAASRGLALQPPPCGIEFADCHASPTAPVQAAAPGGATLDAAARTHMEQAFGASFADVRVHQGDAASRIGAVAFTQGTDIHFAAGAYRPGTPAGLELLGHELAHVQQQRAGRVPGPRESGGLVHEHALESEADAAGERAAAGERVSLGGAGGQAPATAPIQAKLAWTTEKLGDKADKSTKKDKRWKQLIRIMRRYEKLKGEAIDGMPAIGPLNQLREQCLAWLSTRGELPSYAKNNKKKNEITLKGAVEQLAYRDIPREIGVIISGLKEGSTGDKLGGGQVGQVFLSTFGKINAVFKDDQRAKKIDSKAQVAIAGVESGIDFNENPLLANRAVASWQVDQLVGANVTSRSEFATRQTDKGFQHGTASEFVEGTAIQGGGGFPIFEELDWSDPELQRQLSTLQLMDAITGQVDRHGGNFFITQDGEKTKVVGIDNDLSFGKLKLDIDKPNSNEDKFTGFPMYVDEEVAEQVLGVKEHQLRAVLAPLLPEPEVLAALTRLKKAQERLRQLKQTGHWLSKQQWNNETSEKHDTTTYLGRARGFAERNKATGRTVPRGDKPLSNKERKSRNEYLEGAHLKLQMFILNAKAYKKPLTEGKPVEGFAATTPETLLLEVAQIKQALLEKFPNLGAETLFQQLDQAINTFNEYIPN